MPLLQRREGFLGSFAICLSLVMIAAGSPAGSGRYAGRGVPNGDRRCGGQDSGLCGQHLEREKSGIEQPLAISAEENQRPRISGMEAA